MLVLHDVFLGIGSNQGKRSDNLHTATVNVENQIGTIFKESALYETEAWGKQDQPAFLNKVVWIKLSAMDPFEVMTKLLSIETSMGRIRVIKWAQRIIDIDILYYGKMVINTQGLTVPHPQIMYRQFVLTPLAEIAPEHRDPLTHMTFLEMKNNCTDTLQVKQLS